MEHSELLQSLFALDQYETLGKKYFQKYGEPLSSSQFIYTVYHPVTTVEEIMTPSAVAWQQKLRKNFRQQFPDGLTEEYFIHSDRTLEIQKLLRYVDIPPHKHDFIECAFVLRGTCVHKVGDYPYTHKEGSCAIIPSLFEHYLIPSSDCLCLTVKIRRKTFDQMEVPNLPSFFHPLGFQCGQDAFVQHMLLSMYEQQDDQIVYYEQIMGQLFQTILTYIMQRYRDTLQYLVPNAIHDAQMLEILNYSFENYQTITLQALAEHFHFNISYLSNYIHQQSGQTFTDILRDIRLKQAVKFLLDTELPLNDICSAVGYKDTSHFIRNFREMYGTTPIRYRRENRAAE